MIKNNLVSIVMPARNAEKNLGQAILSVQNQSLPDWELIICDDGSTDSTRAVAQSFSDKDPRILVIHNDVSSGPGGARMKAVERATGRWLAFLDSDDWWEAEKLTLSLRHALHHDSALTFTSYTRFIDQTKSFGRTLRVPAVLTYRRLLLSNPIATSSVVIDRDQVSEFELRDDLFFDDYAAWLQILRAGHRAHGLNHPLTVYRMIAGSFSSHKLKAARGVWNIYRAVEGISLPRSLVLFVGYAVNGALKHLIR